VRKGDLKRTWGLLVQALVIFKTHILKFNTGQKYIHWRAIAENGQLRIGHTKE
jgi:hypothetical protein